MPNLAGNPKRIKARKAVEPPKQYLCTECGGDAYIAYSADKNGDWGGLVKVGERVCTRCFRKRGGKAIF